MEGCCDAAQTAREAGRRGNAAVDDRGAPSAAAPGSYSCPRRTSWCVYAMATPVSVYGCMNRVFLAVLFFATAMGKLFAALKRTYIDSIMERGRRKKMVLKSFTSSDVVVAKRKEVYLLKESRTHIHIHIHTAV